MKPLVQGIVFVGGFILLIGTMIAASEDDELKDKEPDTPEGDQVNVEEIRRLRRELRHQLKKKKNLPPKATS